ncbi:MAG: DUF5011 domain-containing protein [Lachnospiraceae bacterium]|nr:DUF5011 domain-containing protein [Lachnospiraceae bacterium]
MDIIVSMAFLLSIASFFVFFLLWIISKVKKSEQLKSRSRSFLIAAVTLFCSFVVLVVAFDTVPPELVTFETTVGYGETISTSEFATATDDRDGLVSVTITGVTPDMSSISADSTSVTFSTPGDYTVTVSAVDEQNNESTSQTVIHVVDQIAPSFTEISDGIEVEYGTTVALSSSQDENFAIFAVAEDEISDVTLYIDSVQAASENSDEAFTMDSSSVCFLLPGQYTVAIVAEDASGNTVSASVPVSVIDSVAPVFTALTDETEVDYGKAIGITDDSTKSNALFAIAEDEVSDVTLSISDVQKDSGESSDDFTLADNTIRFSSPGAYTVTLSAEDDYGNSSSATVAVTVVDAVAPEFSGIQTEYYLADTDSAPDYLSGVTATDEIDGDLTDAIVLDALNVSYGVPGEYTITYHVSDAAGNAVEKSATVTVKDTTPPVISLSSTSVSLTVGDDAPDYSSLVSASDTTDGDVTASVSIDDSAVDYDTPGTYEVVYTVSDSSGNASTKSATVTIKAKTVVVEDTDTSGGGTVYITDTGTKYHKDGCRYLSQSKHAISKARAIALGYEACKVCKP